jgi:hypothetical protein
MTRAERGYSVRRMIRRLAVPAIAVVAAFAAVAPSPGVAAPRTAAPTAVTHVRPVDGHGRLRTGYTVKRTLHHGMCQAGSEATNSAYRCFAGNSVVDPCWASFSKKFVYCLSSPFGFKVTEIRVTKGYQNDGLSKKPSKLPWGVQTSDGTQCIFAQGASSVVKGKRVNYFCGTSDNNVLVGTVHRGGKVWTIDGAKQTATGFKLTDRVSLTRAVFGKPSHKA